MAIKFQYNKTSRQLLEKQLNVRVRALPTLQNKESALRVEVKKAKAEIKQLEQELEEKIQSHEKMVSMWGEFDPTLVSVKDVHLSKRKIAGELLPLADDLDRAEEHGDLAAEGPLRAFADKFRNTLTSLKVTGFGAEGEAFDPEVHEAVQDTSTGDEKVIGAVLRRGYRLDERLIRTAMVVIADPA